MLSLHAFSQSKFSKEEVAEDLRHLREPLEEAHYNLYAYTAKETFDSAYTEVKNAINQDSLTLLETTNLFPRLISVVKNGHTSIDFPVSSYIAYAQAGGTLFPLEIALENSRAFIRKNWSGNESIKTGSAF